MDAVVSSERTYRSPNRVLVRFFERSRNNWKGKVAGLRSKIKDLNVRIYDLEKSRAQWREEAERRAAEVQSFSEDLERLRNPLAPAGQSPKKKVTPLGTNRMASPR